MVEATAVLVVWMTIVVILSIRAERVEDSVSLLDLQKTKQNTDIDKAA